MKCATSVALRVVSLWTTTVLSVLLMQSTCHGLTFDFESDRSGFTVLDGTFGQWVSDRSTEYITEKPFNKEGQRFLSTLDPIAGQKRSDGFIGEIVSPLFKLTGKEMTLLVGGGKGKDVGVALCRPTGERLMIARGGNEQVLRKRTWDVSKYVGETLLISVFDHSAKSWGHILVDSITFDGVIDAKATKEFHLYKLSTIHAEKLRNAVHSLADDVPNYPVKEALARIDAREEPYKTLSYDLLVKQNPLINTNKILFVARHQYATDHHNTATLFQPGEVNTFKYKPGGAFMILDPKTGKAETFYQPKKGSVVRDPELHFDGDRLLFSMRKNIEDCYHIYETSLSKKKVRALTSKKLSSDIDPMYLPDGDIIFSSTREPKFCMCNRHIMCNLFRMEGDGANIHQVAKSTLFEGHPALLPDGRVLYDRWEYVDRNFGTAQSLWTMNPDGTVHAVYYGNNTGGPGGFIDAKPIPGSSWVIMTVSSCHDLPWGGLAILDRSKGVDGKEPIVYTWPQSLRDQFKIEGDFDYTWRKVSPKYEDPFPLTKDFHLCARTVSGGKTGLFLIDTFGNEIKLYEDEKYSSFSPVVIAPRAKPITRPTQRDFVSKNGKFYIQDVTIGTHMKGVKKEDVGFLRIVESPPKRTFSPQGQGRSGSRVSHDSPGEQAPALNWSSLENKQVLGVVPVESDGSAYFEVPANKFVYFQLLDKKGRMIHSMRSGTMLQPGELQGCVGCHEPRVGDSPAVQAGAIKAMQRPADKMTGLQGKTRPFDYQVEVQPILDRACVQCHDYDKPAGKKLNLSGDRSDPFCISYADLWGKGYVGAIGAGPSRILDAYAWGSTKSKLIKKLEAGHAKKFLKPADLEMLITWVDINGPYYGSYETAQFGSRTGRSSLTTAQSNRLNKLVGRNTVDYGPAQINFTRPEKSACLAKLDPASAEYKEALAIIRSGREKMLKTPRADMANFIPDPEHVSRLKFYSQRSDEEAAIYKAISVGKRIYDPGINRNRINRNRINRK